MEVPALGHEADRGDIRREQRLEARIVGDGPARPLGHAKGGELGVAERPRFGEELGVSRIGAGITRFDIVEPKRIELLGNQPFILDREIDPVRLRAVAQRRIVERDAFAGHDLSYTSPKKKCSASSTANNRMTSLMTK